MLLTRLVLLLSNWWFFLIERILDIDLEDLGKEGLIALKLQIVLIVVLFFGLIESMTGFPLYPLVFFGCLYYFYEIWRVLTSDFRERFYFASFFGVLMVVVVGSVYFVRFFPKDFLNPLNTALLFGGFFVVLVLLKDVFTKNVVHGTVLLSNDKIAVVRIGFSLKAGITAGKYIVKTSKKFDVGEKVVVRLRKGLFSKKPYLIESE